MDMDAVAGLMFRADEVHAGEKASELPPLGAGRFFEWSSSSFWKEGEIETIFFLKRLSVVASERRDDGNFGGGEFGDEFLFVFQRGAAPSSGAVELGDDPRVVLQFHFIDAVDVARERATQVCCSRGERIFHPLQHHIRSEAGEICWCVLRHGSLRSARKTTALRGDFTAFAARG